MTVPNTPFFASAVITEVEETLPGFVSSTRIRTMLGVPSGPFLLSLAAGKSYLTIDFYVHDMEDIGVGFGGIRRVQRVMDALVTGGVGPFTYSWTISENTENTLLGSTTSDSCRISQTYDEDGDTPYPLYENSLVTLTVTDTGTGTTKTVSKYVFLDVV